VKIRVSKCPSLHSPEGLSSQNSGHARPDRDPGRSNAAVLLQAANQPVDNGPAFPQREQLLFDGGNTGWGGAFLNHNYIDAPDSLVLTIPYGVQRQYTLVGVGVAK